MDFLIVIGWGEEEWSVMVAVMQCCPLLIDKVEGEVRRIVKCGVPALATVRDFCSEHIKCA